MTNLKNVNSELKVMNLVSLEKHFIAKKQNKKEENKIIFLFFFSLFCFITSLTILSILF